MGGRVTRRLEGLLDESAAEHGGEIVASAVVPDFVPIFVQAAQTDLPAAVARLFEYQWDRVA